MAAGTEVLYEILTKVGKEQGYENCQISTKQISTGGANYTSHLYLATLSTPGKDDLKLFVKVAVSGEEMRKIVPIRIFEIESFGYRQLLKKYRELEEKHSVPEKYRLVTPKFYGCSDEYLREALVLEDLSASGYTTFDRFKYIDWNYASKSVQNLTKLHALSIAWSVAEPEEFEKTQTMKLDADSEGAMSYFKNVVANAIEATREENKDRFSKFANKLMEDKEAMAAFYKPVRRPVISHGDYRPSNLMHRTNEDGTVDVISVDYQTLQQGNPITDLLYFIYTGSDKNFRTKHFKEILEYYYTELRAALQRLDLDPDQLYSRDVFDYELKQILPFGLMTSIFCLLIVTVDVQDAPKVSQAMTIEDFAINPNTLYKGRLNDVIDDFIDMGIL